MGGKKKKGGKGKKGGDDGGKDGKLPPPPNLEQTRQGAAEALLTFQIRGKEETVDLYQEEAETFKEKNYQQKDRNYQLKQQQATHYQKLVEEAQGLQENIDKAETVERNTVEAALKEKLDLAKQYVQKLADENRKIAEVEAELKIKEEELLKWREYRDDICDVRSEQIEAIQDQMQHLETVERELQDQLDRDLKDDKEQTDKKVGALKEKQEKEMSQRIKENLDTETKSELRDNFWLKDQISLMKKTVESLRREADAMEHRNIKLIRTVADAHNREVQAMSDAYNLSTGRGLHSRQAGESGLPSLVDVTKTTSDQGAGGKVGQYELQLLSLQGSRPPFHATPESVHLPPIEQQRSSHTALPPRTKWPISNTMLSSVLAE